MRLIVILIIVSTCLASETLALDYPETDPVNEGIYIEMGAGDAPDTLGGELGIFGYLQDHLSFRAGLACLASESFDDFFVGLNTGFRLTMLPQRYRFTPFIGLGLFGGYTKTQVKADDDGEDNDHDGDVDEAGEEDSVIDDVMASIYPEAGVQIWVSGDTRLTLSGKYNYTTEGRDTDFWVFNVGMAWLF